jgi:arabinofuranosyltransferase
MAEQAPAAAAPSAPLRPIQVLAVAIVALVVLKSAWVCDDAFITLRTIDNLVHGHGLRWNVSERVQSYTHPLWLWVMTPIYAVVRSGYFTAILASLAVTIAAAGVFAFVLARSWPAILLGAIAMVGSRGFVDYSTSGLENPLTHLLALAFLALFLRRSEATPRSIGALGLLAALGALNRLDTLLLVLPPLLWLVWTSPRRGAALRALVLGFTPLVAWFLFALVYYGFALPNTYDAKIQTGVSTPFLWSHGVAYLLDAARTDRLSLLVPIAAGAAALNRRLGREIAVVAGIALYVAYVVHVGGDFMSGRFLTAPFVIAVGLLASMDGPWTAPRDPAVAWTAASLLVLGLTGPRPPLLPDPVGYGTEHPETLCDPSGVCDERGFYASFTALSAVHASRLIPEHPWALRGLADGRRGVPVSVQGSVGFYGYFAGPGVHVVDLMALTDPLLARLPAGVDRPRIGHYERRVPLGYLATLESGENRIVDRRLARLYPRLREIVAGPFFSPSRWRAIAALHLGRYHELVDRAAYREPHPASLAVTLAPVAGADYWQASGAGEPLPLAGLVVDLPEPNHRERLSLRLAARGLLRARLLSGPTEAARLPVMDVPAATDSGWVTFAVPAGAAAAGYDRIHVEMVYAFDEARLGAISLAGAQVRAARDVHDLPLGPEGIWIPVPGGSRLETVRVVAGAGDALTATLMAPGAAPVACLLAPKSAHARGSGSYVIDASATPLAATADRFRLEPALPGERVTLRAVEVVTSPSPPR